MKKQLLSPVPTSVWWKIKVGLLSILWFFNTSKDKKDWKEFYYGLVPHKCQFDWNNVIMDEFGGYAECKHYGCNFIEIKL